MSSGRVTRNNNNNSGASANKEMSNPKGAAAKMEKKAETVDNAKKNSKSDNGPKSTDKTPPPPIPPKETSAGPDSRTSSAETDNENGNDGQKVTSAVIGHFSSRWQVFIQGIEKDFKNMEEDFKKVLKDPKEGLVVRMENVEKTVTEITEGKAGGKGLNETLQNFETRLASVESGGKTLPTEVVNAVLTKEGLKEINDKIDMLETENKKLKAIVDEIAEMDDDNQVKLKHFEFVDMKGDIEHFKYFQETTTGFLTITEKRMDSMDSRVIANTANSMQNSIIIGGVRVQEDESVIQAVQRFLSTLMNLTPKPFDIYDAEQLGKGYTKTVNGKEINFPPAVKVRCSENFAARIMGNASSLAGKQDAAGGFKYYVKRSRLEAQRALHDKYNDEARGYREQNANATSETDKVKFHFTPTQFIVNEVPQEDPVRPPSYKEMVNLDFPTLFEMRRVEFHSSLPKSVKRSVFQAFGLAVNSLDEINLAYKQIRFLHKAADHIVAGYRIKVGETILQGCAHNREYYGDREILQTLKKSKAVNLVVFIVREYGGIHLGGARFDIITDLTNEVLRMMKPETADVPTPSKPPPQKCPLITDVYTDTRLCILQKARREIWKIPEEKSVG